jgi:hypothetical protein
MLNEISTVFSSYYILFLDAVFLFVLFYSLVANKRQGLLNIDFNPLINFCLVRFLIIIISVFYINNDLLAGSALSAISFSLNILSFYFIFDFGLGLLSRKGFYLAPSLLFLTLSALYFENYYIYLFIFSALALLSFLGLSLVLYRKGIKENFVIFKYLSILLIPVPFIYLGVFFFENSSTPESPVFLLLVATRAVAAIVLSFATFYLYTVVHRNNIPDKKEDVSWGFKYTEIIRSVFFVFLISITIFSCLAFWFAEEYEYYEFKDHHKLEIKGLKHSIDLAQSGSLHLLSAMRQSPVFKEDSFGSEDLQNLLSRYSKIIPETIIYVMDSDGDVIDSSNRHLPDSFVGQNYSARPYFTDIVSGATSSQYVAVGITSKLPGFYSSVSGFIFSKRDPVVLVAKNDLHDFYSFYSGCHFSIDGDGVIFDSSCREIIGTSIFPIDSEKAQEKIKNKQYFKISDKSLFDDESKARNDNGHIFVKEKQRAAIFERETEGLLRHGFYTENYGNVFIWLSFWYGMLGFTFVLIVLFFTKILEHQSRDMLKKRELATIKSRDEAEIAKAESDKKSQEVEKLNQFMIGRELKMIDLKGRVKELEEKLKNK